jgi:hypothetical protein
VLASDGLHTATSATTSPVTVANKPPQMQLAAPVNGDWIPSGEAVVFRGYATDTEDQVVDDGAFHWSSSIDGDLGTGSTLWGLPLSDGDHVITLAVTDRSGETVSQSVGIRVGAQPVAAAGPSTSPLVLLMASVGFLLLLGAGVGALVYAARSRQARRASRGG